MDGRRGLQAPYPPLPLRHPDCTRLRADWRTEPEREEHRLSEIESPATVGAPPARLYLVRHALTHANSAGRNVGKLDVSLSEEGMAQARELAERGSSLGIASVWTSPLARARETARVVGAELRVPVRVEEDLAEMGLGPWEGLSEDEIRGRYPAEHARWQADPSALDLPGHEGLGPTQVRAVAAVERILARGEDALCVTHLGVLRVVAAHYECRELNAFASITPGHGELFELRRSNGGTRWRALSEGEA